MMNMFSHYCRYLINYLGTTKSYVAIGVWRSDKSCSDIGYNFGRGRTGPEETTTLREIIEYFHLSLPGGVKHKE